MPLGFRPAVVVDKKRQPQEHTNGLPGVHNGAVVKNRNMLETCRTLLHMHTRTCVCGGLVDLCVG